MIDPDKLDTYRASVKADGLNESFDDSVKKIRELAEEMRFRCGMPMSSISATLADAKRIERVLGVIPAPTHQPVTVTFVLEIEMQVPIGMTREEISAYVRSNAASTVITDTTEIVTPTDKWTETN